jgi:hypothetical protein
LPVSVIVPVAGVPDTTLAGLIVKLESVGVSTISGCPIEEPLNEAVIVTVTLAATGELTTVKVADEASPDTKTELDTLAAFVLLEARVTLSPAGGAGPVSVTVPVELFPPRTSVGDSDSDLTVGAVTLSVVVAFDALSEAVSVAVAFAATETVLTLAVADLLPASTLTDFGIDAAGFELASVTSTPPAGATLESVTVALAGVPPITLVGVTVRLETVWARATTIPKDASRQRAHRRW